MPIMETSEVRRLYQGRTFVGPETGKGPGFSLCRLRACVGDKDADGEHASHLGGSETRRKRCIHTDGAGIQNSPDRPG